MSVVYSAEARWFFRIPVNIELLKWFSPEREPFSEPERQDDYLPLANCESVSVKIRQEKLEIKAQTCAAKLLRINGLSGKTDEWIKWTFADEQMKLLADAMRQSEPWIPVRKLRYLRKFSGDTGKLVEVAVDEKPWPIIGCNFELTAISGERTGSWTSLAFEAFGPPLQTVRTLNEALNMILNNVRPPLVLDTLSSYGYPTWIATLIARLT